MQVYDIETFLRKYGSYRLDQILEILADPTDPAPQDHIAEICGVSKSTVSGWVKSFIIWEPKLNPEAAKKAAYQVDFEEFRAERTKEVIKKHSTILRLPVDNRRA